MHHLLAAHAVNLSFATGLWGAGAIEFCRFVRSSSLFSIQVSNRGGFRENADALEWARFESTLGG